MKQKVYKVYNESKRLIFITESEIDLYKIMKQRRLNNILIKETYFNEKELIKHREEIISDEFLGFPMSEREFNMIRKNIPNDFIYSEAIVDIFYKVLLEKGMNYKFGVVKEMYDLAKIIYDNNKEDIEEDILEILSSVNGDESLYFKIIKDKA